MSPCGQDASFGPASTCRSFDFTLRFEQIILSFLLDLVFTLLACLRIAYLWRQQSPLARWGKVFVAKIAVVLIVLAACAANVAFTIRGHDRTLIELWIPAPIFHIIAMTALSSLILLEHGRSVTPSTLALLYIVLKIIFVGATFRSYIKMGLMHVPHGTALADSTAVAMGSLILMLIVEVIEKRRLLTRKDLPRISTSSFLSRLSYAWFFPLLWKGRDKTTPLTIDSCGRAPDAYSAETTRSAIEAALLATDNRLGSASVRAFLPQFLAPVLPRLVLLGVTFAQPLLINQLVSFVSDPARPDEEGWLLLGAFVCVYFLFAAATSVYWEKTYDAAVAYRGALVGLIYAKTLRLSAAAGRSLGGGAATTYMSVDVERISQGFLIFHEMWAALVSIPVAIVILHHFASWPAFLPLAVALIMLVAAGAVGLPMAKSQARWLAATAERTKFISSVLTGFLPLQLAGLSAPLARTANKLRRTETEEQGSFYKSLVVSVSFTSAAFVVASLSVLGPYAALSAGSGGRLPALDAARLFTIVSTIQILQQPLGLLGQALPAMASMAASLKRIQELISMDEYAHRAADGDAPQEKASDEKFDEQGELVEMVQVSRAASTKSDFSAREVSCTSTPPLSVRDASFSWAPDAEPFLKGITLDLRRAGLYVCVGPVASGKSLLLSSLLGEAVLKTGTYAPPRARIAYASQDAVIMPGTVRENILFGRAHDAARYARVVDACALRPDFERMQGGDGKVLAEKGAGISGGQKQRIALARAVYADAAWTFLDDPLSALDARTEEHVFHALFGPGGLMVGKAVLLVTHNVQYLHSASSIVVMNAGQIQYQGTLAEIEQQGFVPQSAIERREVKQEDQMVAADEYVPEQESEEPPIAASSLGLTPYKFFLGLAGWKNVTFCVVLLLFNGATTAGMTGYMREWAKHGDEPVGPWIGGYAGISVAVFIASLISLRQFASMVTDTIAPAAHAKLAEGVFNASPAFFMSTPAERVINRFSQDIFMVDFEFPLHFWFVASLGISTIGLLVFIFIPSPWLLISLPPLVIVYWMTVRLYLLTSKQLQHLEASSKSPLYGMFSSTLTGLETVRAHHAETHFQALNDNDLNRSQSPYFYRFAGLRFLRTALALLSLFFAIGLAAFAVGLRHKIDAAFLGAALSSLINLEVTVSSLLNSYAEMENGSVSISRIHEYASLPPEEDKKSAPDAIPEWPSKGNVSLKSIVMRYKPDSDPALREVSFDIPAGTKIGICGRSGSGKSSLIMALFRALDKTRLTGEVVIDSHDTTNVAIAQLRHSMSLVSQEPVIWRASLRDNLDPEGSCGDEELWTVLRTVGLEAAVSELENKLETMLEEGGSLSKGQRQLLCLARILLKKKPIIVLDEASSSLDNETDEKMRRVVRDEFADCTVIAVAHRIATIIDFDQIVVMDRGQVIERGTPQELLARPESHFRTLAESQGLHAAGS